GEAQPVGGSRETPAAEEWLAGYEEPSAPELDAAMREEGARRERVEAVEGGQLSWKYHMVAHEWRPGGGWAAPPAHPPPPPRRSRSSPGTRRSSARSCAARSPDATARRRTRGPSSIASRTTRTGRPRWRSSRSTARRRRGDWLRTRCRTRRRRTSPRSRRASG